MTPIDPITGQQTGTTAPLAPGALPADPTNVSETSSPVAVTGTAKLPGENEAKHEPGTGEPPKWPDPATSDATPSANPSSSGMTEADAGLGVEGEKLPTTGAPVEFPDPSASPPQSETPPVIGQLDDAVLGGGDEPVDENDDDEDEVQPTDEVPPPAASDEPPPDYVNNLASLDPKNLGVKLAAIGKDAWAFFQKDLPSLGLNQEEQDLARRALYNLSAIGLAKLSASTAEEIAPLEQRAREAVSVLADLGAVKADKTEKAVKLAVGKVFSAVVDLVLHGITTIAPRVVPGL